MDFGAELLVKTLQVRKRAVCAACKLRIYGKTAQREFLLFFKTACSLVAGDVVQRWSTFLACTRP